MLKYSVLLGFLFLVGCAPSYTKIGFDFDVNNERRLEGKNIQKSSFQGVINEQKKVILVMVSGGYRNIDMYDETKTLVNEFFYQRKYNISSHYDEESFKKDMQYYNYRVSLDFYLQRRNQSFTPHEIRTMRKLGFKKTPALLIMDLSGNTLESFQGIDTPELGELHDLLCGYTTIAGKGLCE